MSSDRSTKVTEVDTSTDTVRRVAVSGQESVTPVWTSWCRPESRRSMPQAASSSSGFSRISPPTSTVVSAATTRSVRSASGDSIAAAAFSIESRRTYPVGGSSGWGVSSMSAGRTAKVSPAVRRSSRRLGEPEASTSECGAGMSITASAAGECHHVAVVGHRDITIECGTLLAVEPAVRNGDPDRAVGVAALDALTALDDRGPVVESADDLVEFVERGTHRKTPAHLGPDRVSRHVPTRVFAEVAHRVVLAHVVGEEPRMNAHHVTHLSERPARRSVATVQRLDEIAEQPGPAE